MDLATCQHLELASCHYLPEAPKNSVPQRSERAVVQSIQGPALACLSAIDKKSVYWYSSWARILNVQDIIGEDKFKYIAGASQHSFNSCLLCTLYRGCRPTHQIPVQCWASVAAQCWFNAGQLSAMLFCCIVCANTWHSTNAVSILTHSRWPSKQHWVIALCLLTAA